MRLCQAMPGAPLTRYLPITCSKMKSKEIVIGLVKDMPGRINMSEIIYRLHVIDEIRKGEDDIQHGRVFSMAQMNKRSAKWA